jgi:hypothetical protein
MSQELWDDLWGSPKEEEVPSKSFNSMTLAKYFRDGLMKASWYKGFGMVNMLALAKNIKAWKDQGEERIKLLIDTYLTDESLRGKNPGWQDFLYNAERIAESLDRKPSTKDYSGTNTDKEYEEWLKANGDA